MKIVGPYTSPTIYSENPGIVELTSSDPSVASVDASVVIPGTRVWRNGLKYGQYLAREGASTAARVGVAWYIEINPYDYLISTKSASRSAYYLLAANQKWDAGEKINWAIRFNSQTGSSYHPYWALAPILDWSIIIGTGYQCPYSASIKIYDNTPRRYIIEYDGTYVAFYHTTGTTYDARSAFTFAGTMGGDEKLIVTGPHNIFAKSHYIPSQAQREAFMASGTLPAGLAASYQGGHEIDPTAPVFWDTSGNNLDLSDVDVLGWPPAAASGDYTDDPGDPVVPFQPFTITPNSTGTFTITARRRRQGVPDRATDEEKYETTSETFTITEMPAEVVQYVRLLITTSTQGTVDIASSDPAVVTFPASVVVGPTLQYEVLGTVVGAGTSIITTSMGGAVLDTTTVTIEAEPTVVKCGPSQDIRSRI
jgi:hypothetical protein